ncbi:MAG TPA: hypothetical protein VJU13_11665 [Candidatus Nitrosocosmicus sp.]|nr:hypothetical protein [Candidatus Nitrosocosmicus sp.]
MVHVPFDTNSVSLSHFGSPQVGGGDYAYFTGYQPYQRFNQTGYGLGDILRSIWRVIFPVLKSAGTVASKEALSTGTRILDKMEQGENLKQAIINEGKKGMDNLLEKGGVGRQFGTGLRKSIKGKTKRKSSLVSTNSLVGKKVKFAKRQRSDAFGFY